MFQLENMAWVRVHRHQVPLVQSPEVPVGVPESKGETDARRGFGIRQRSRSTDL